MSQTLTPDVLRKIRSEHDATLYAIHQEYLRLAEDQLNNAKMAEKIVSQYLEGELLEKACKAIWAKHAKQVEADVREQSKKLAHATETYRRNFRSTPQYQRYHDSSEVVWLRKNSIFSKKYVPSTPLAAP